MAIKGNNNNVSMIESGKGANIIKITNNRNDMKPVGIVKREIKMSLSDSVYNFTYISLLLPTPLYLVYCVNRLLNHIRMDSKILCLHFF